MKILIQFPTLGRPDKFLHVFRKYTSMSSGKHDLFFNINCDSADFSMTAEYVKTSVHESYRLLEHVQALINYDVATSKISAINSNITEVEFDWDIVVCASDDMVPKVDGWDNEIAIAMEEHFPNLDGCVHFNDGNTNGELITFSILGKKLYESFGYIYHPDYKSLYCDNEFTEEIKRMNREKYIDKVIVSHEHWSVEGSENHNEVDIAVRKTLHYSGRDQRVFEARKSLGFPRDRITED